MSSFDYVEFPQACGSTWEEIQESEVSFSKGFCWAGLIKGDKRFEECQTEDFSLWCAVRASWSLFGSLFHYIVTQAYPEFCLSLLASVYKNRHKSSSRAHDQTMPGPNKDDVSICYGVIAGFTGLIIRGQSYWKVAAIWLSLQGGRGHEGEQLGSGTL